MQKEKLMERTRKDLRSVLISAPRGVPVRLILTDFKMVLGYELPFRQLGFQRLDEFIMSIPDVVRVDRVNGEPTCLAIADASTSQIARFVATQKKPKLKRSNAPPLVRKPQTYTGFTKKGRFGPSSARPKTYTAYGGRRSSSGSGSVYTGGPGGPRQKPYSAYGKGGSKPSQYYAPPPRFRSEPQRQPMAPINKSPILKSLGYSNNISAGRSNSTPASARLGSMNNNGPSSSFASAYSDKIGSSAVKGPSPSMKGSIPQSGSFFSIAPASRTVSGTAITIKELEERCHQNPNLTGMVTVEGFIAGEKRFDQPNQTVKYLLYSGLSSPKRGDFPAVMLFFKKEAWNIEEQSLDFQNIPVGSKLRVTGIAVAQQNRNKGCYEPAIKVFNYTYISLFSSSFLGGTHASKSRSSSLAVSQDFSSPPRAAASAESSQQMERLIFELMKAKKGGIWSKRLGNEFKTMHRRDPPENILNIALSLPFITRDEDAYGDNFIVALKEGVTELPGAAKPPVVSFTTQKPELPNTVEFTSSNDYIDVNVAYINNPISFYLTRVGKGYSEDLEAMTEEMSAQFSKSRIKPVSGIQENQLYGYPWYVDNEVDSWCRVLTSRVTGKAADVYFPDYGNSETVSVSDLVELPRKFYKLPFQAVHCCLHGCTGVGEEATKLFIEVALEKNCVAQIMDSSGTRLAVELIDPESESGDTTINSVIMTALHPISTLVPSLPKPGETRVPVILTDVDEDGVVTVQLKGPGVSRLQHLMTLINEKYKKSHAADFVTQVTEGKIYCTQFFHDNKFYRVLVKKAIPHKLLVQYVDYGNEDETEIKKLRRPLSDPLFKLPPQAVKCQLHGVPPPGKPWSDDATFLVASYSDCDDLYLTTIESGKGQDLPMVKLTVVRGDSAESVDEDDLADLILQEYENTVQANDEEGFIDISEPEPGADSKDNSSAFHQSVTSPVVDTPLGLSSVLGYGSPESAHLDGKPNSNSTPLLDNSVITPSIPTSERITPSVPSFSSVSKQSTSSVVNPVRNPELFPVSKSLVPPVSKSAAVATTPPSESPAHSGEFPMTPQTPSDAHTPSMSPTPLQLSLPLSPLDISTAAAISSPLFSPTPPSISSTGLTSDDEILLAAAALSLNGQDEVPIPPSPRSELQFALLSSEKPQHVSVVWTKSPHFFIIQLLSENNHLEDVMKSLNDPLLSRDSVKPADIKEGLVCCACSSMDERWYRVWLVGSTHPGPDVVIGFLDYGGTEIVKKSNLKYLPDMFLQLPFQGIACTLQAVEPVNNKEWSEEATTWFQDHVLDKILFAVELTKDRGHSCITLLDTSSGKTVDVRDSLKNAGFAKLIKKQRN